MSFETLFYAVADFHTEVAFTQLSMLLIAVVVAVTVPLPFNPVGTCSHQHEYPHASRNDRRLTAKGATVHPSNTNGGSGSAYRAEAPENPAAVKNAMGKSGKAVWEVSITNKSDLEIWHRD
jgi:hypothetical protein